MKNKKWSPKRILIGIAIALCTAWATFPFYWAITTSLRKPAETFTVAGLAIPFVQFKPTLENWAAELKVPENLKAMKNSVIIALTSAIFATALGTMAGYGLARFQFYKIKNADITIWFLSQRVLPPVVVAIPFFLLARQFQALDKVSTLIVLNTTFNLPFAVIIMNQLFKELPIELEQAAMVDGFSGSGPFLKLPCRCRRRAWWPPELSAWRLPGMNSCLPSSWRSEMRLPYPILFPVHQIPAAYSSGSLPPGP